MSIQSGLAYLVDEDRIDFTKGIQALLRDLSDASDTKAGTGEGMTVDQLLGKTELSAERSDLVLEQVLERFQKLPLQVLWETSDIVMRLDCRRGAAEGAPALHDVRIERPLCKIRYVTALAGL